MDATMTVPKPPPRCPRCGAFDSWEETPTMYRRELSVGDQSWVDYEDDWRCGICGQEWRVPMPAPPPRMLP